MFEGYIENNIGKFIGFGRYIKGDGTARSVVGYWENGYRLNGKAMTYYNF